ncbi:MAG: enzyme protein [Euryarchaeota archaeon]|nr:enzyme protein [Euryarchaeota archaeon]
MIKENAELAGTRAFTYMKTREFLEAANCDPHKAANMEDLFNNIFNGFLLSERLKLPFALITNAGLKLAKKLQISAKVYILQSVNLFMYIAEG